MLEQWSLALCPNVAIQYFGTDTEGKGLQEIQNAVLYKSGLNKTVTTILLKKSVNKVYVDTGANYTSAFDGYAIINNWPTYKFEGYFGDLRDQNNNKITNIGTTGLISIATEEVLVD